MFIASLNAFASFPKIKKYFCYAQLKSSNVDEQLGVLKTGVKGHRER